MPTLTPKLTTGLDADTLDFINHHLNDMNELHDGLISTFVDARQMPCPMPLLKAKVALRLVANDESLYLIASDKNSQNDLVAFCQKNCLQVKTWQTHNTENCFHFIITKNGVKKASV